MPRPWFEDRVTGLAFQACSSDDGMTCDRGRVTKAEAAAHCGPLTWGGRDDWRWPTFTEVHALFDPRIDDLSPNTLSLGSSSFVMVNDGSGDPALLQYDTGERVGIGASDAEDPLFCVGEAH